MPDPPQTRPAAVLDVTAFPHLLDSILAFAPPASLLRLRGVSRLCRGRADARLAAHLVLEDRGMGGRWFAAWHASLCPSSRASRPSLTTLDPSAALFLAASYNAYSVYTHSGRLRTLGAPARDTHYNWQGFVRSGKASFTPGAGAYLKHTRVLDLVGDVGVLSDSPQGRFPLEIPLTRLLPGPSGEIEERPPPSTVISVFPSPGDLEPSAILDISAPAGCRKVVVNVGWHDAPGLIRARLRDLDGVGEVVISFAGWRDGSPSSGKGRGGPNDSEEEGGLTLMHGPEAYIPAYVAGNVEGDRDDDEDADVAETLPWSRNGPRDNDPLRWQELAFLVALALSCGCKVTVVDLESVSPAWLDADFIEAPPASNTRPGSTGEGNSSASTYSQPSQPSQPDDTTPAQAPEPQEPPSPRRGRADIIREMKATLRGLGQTNRDMPSFWLVNGLRVYGLCTVVMPAKTRPVRFLTAAQYAERGEELEARLELEACIFAGV